MECPKLESLPEPLSSLAKLQALCEPFDASALRSPLTEGRCNLVERFPLKDLCVSRYLSGTGVASLPDSIGNLRSLTSLCVTHFRQPTSFCSLLPYSHTPIGLHRHTAPCTLHTAPYPTALVLTPPTLNRLRFLGRAM
jgi:hypothetical protein